MKLEDMVKRHGSWLETGVDEGPVISSRIRLARNLEPYSFPGWASGDSMQSAWEEISAVFDEIREPFTCWSMLETVPLEREILFERHLISQELAGLDRACGVFVSTDECLSIMINEEDHVRIQSLQPGLNLMKAWRMADELDDELEEHMNYAFSPKLGYLTSCPSNLGTGMRASVMMHLPGLVLIDQMEPVINGISKIGLAVRGMWGEGTEAAGNMFQISNQSTLGRREDEIISNLEQIVLEMVDHERNAREKLMQDRPLVVEDHVARAFGILSHAKMLTSIEALNLLSTLRLGMDLGIINNLTRNELDTLFISIQPAHLQKIESKTLTADERDLVRAEVLRAYMKNARQDDSENGK